ncbi:MAG: hypothetical protein ACREKH_09045 [Candidatus Rokuibacteriota bacterium]
MAIPRLPGRVMGLATALLLVAQPGAASHFHMGRPPVPLDQPPVPTLVGPLGTAYASASPRSIGNVVFDEKCASIINFNNLQGLQVSDGVPGTGDEIICTSHLWIGRGQTSTFGTLLTRGEIRKGGRMHTSARLDKETAMCTPQSGDAWFELRGTRCYEPDPAYAPTIDVPFATDPTQGFVLGAYAPRPASRLIAIEGSARAADRVR